MFWGETALPNACKRVRCGRHFRLGPFGQLPPSTRSLTEVVVRSSAVLQCKTSMVVPVRAIASIVTYVCRRISDEQAMASLRLFMPRAGLSLSSKQLQHRLHPIALRAASTSPPKPRVLEKPERFNPPSHPSRIRSRQRRYPGPPLSEHEREAQKIRRYPNMMPPKGTFLFKVLTNRMLHVWISMVRRSAKV